MRKFVIIILTILAIPMCMAKDDLSDCVADAIRYTKAIGDYLLYTTATFGDSISKAKLALIEKPDVYYVDNNSYWSEEVKELIYCDELRSWELPKSVKMEYGLEKENIRFTCDSIAVLGAKNLIARFGNSQFLPGDSVESVLDTTKLYKIYNMIEVNGFGISGDTLYVFTGFSQLDNYARNVISPIYFELNYVLTNDGWKNRRVAYSNIGTTKYYRDPDIYEKANELELIIPFAYSRFHSLLSLSDAYGDMRNSKRNVNGEMKDYVWILMSEDCGYEIFLPIRDKFYPNDKLKINDSLGSIIYENTNLAVYRGATSLLHYHPITDSVEYKEKLKYVTDTVNSKCRYVMGMPDFELHGDSISVRFDYYEVIATSNNWDANEGDMLMCPKLTYQCVMAYDKDDGDWHFVMDLISESEKTLTYFEKSSKERLEDLNLPILLWDNGACEEFWRSLRRGE